MAEAKKSKEQQILEEAADRVRVFLKDNTPVFRGEEDLVIDAVMGKFATNKILAEKESIAE